MFRSWDLSIRIRKFTNPILAAICNSFWRLRRGAACGCCQFPSVGNSKFENVENGDQEDPQRCSCRPIPARNCSTPALPHGPSKTGAPPQTTRLQPPPASYDSGANRATHNPIARLPTYQPQLPITKKFEKQPAQRHIAIAVKDSPYTVQAFSIPLQTGPYQLWKQRPAQLVQHALFPSPQQLPVLVRSTQIARPHSPAHTRHTTRIEGPHATADRVL